MSFNAEGEEVGKRTRRKAWILGLRQRRGTVSLPQRHRETEERQRKAFFNAEGEEVFVRSRRKAGSLVKAGS